MMDDDSRMTIMYHYIYTLSWYFQSLAPSLVNGFDTFWTNTGYLLFITNKAHTSWLDVTGFFHASFDQREHATFSRNAVSFFSKACIKTCWATMINCYNLPQLRPKVAGNRQQIRSSHRIPPWSTPPAESPEVKALWPTPVVPWPQPSVPPNAVGYSPTSIAQERERGRICKSCSAGWFS